MVKNCGNNTKEHNLVTKLLLATGSDRKRIYRYFKWRDIKDKIYRCVVGSAKGTHTYCEATGS